jgi:hypothetical protein
MNLTTELPSPAQNGISHAILSVVQVFKCERTLVSSGRMFLLKHTATTPGALSQSDPVRGRPQPASRLRTSTYREPFFDASCTRLKHFL